MKQIIIHRGDDIVILITGVRSLQIEFSFIDYINRAGQLKHVLVKPNDTVTVRPLWGG